MSRKRVVIGLLGTTLDIGRTANRWERWRPTVSMCQHDDLGIDRLELLVPSHAMNMAKQVAEDIGQVSPHTKVGLHATTTKDPWDFEEVYTTLHDFAAGYRFDQEREEYLVHITTGTHVAQICLFLLTETRRFPAKLIQTSPKLRTNDPTGDYRIIDLDLSKYHSIAARFQVEFRDNIAGLKSGIATRNAAFNRLIEELEHVAAHSVDPILITGPTGAGKSQLARRIYELKASRHRLSGPFVEVNCATLKGDSAMSALFGHRKGAFTGAMADRPGLLRSADGGMLFLDEIGELGLDEQAMILRAVEEGRFLPLGADKEVTSRFQLIAGTNRELLAEVTAGRFREDLFARLNLWTFRLPSLAERPEDIEPNLDYEMERFAAAQDLRVTFNKEAREAYLAFATGPAAAWRGNFRDLSASVTRMATLAPAGRIDRETVELEIGRLKLLWSGGASSEPDILAAVLGDEDRARLDPFDRAQLSEVVRVCRRSASMSEAGRTLFAASRQRRSSTNDADRLRKYLARFGLTFERVRDTAKPA
ncbi:MAG: RNA repair transcriptional activator RtcR [Phycisphaerae bacterium]|nr:RNA repair transcriptional activator RtcR [Phycisphaerae bacterium]